MSERDLIERLRAERIAKPTSLTMIAFEITPNPICQEAADAIARLSEALAEAEKKGAEVRELPWERRAFGGLWTAKTSLGSYFIDANEEPCEWAFGRQDYRAAGSLEEAKTAAQADYEARVRACLAPPRDLSQGGQHGCA